MRFAALLPLSLPVAYAQLNTLAIAAGLKYFGTATDAPAADPAYIAVLSNTSEFGQITPANEQKWDAIEPSNGVFSFTAADAITSLAEKNGQLLRCHNLVWYNQLPSWVSTGPWTNETLIAAMQAHITGEVTHYKGQCYAWDVVNEALNDNGTFRTDVFYNIIGEDYIRIAFETAAAADPSAKLYYNDFNIETAGVKSTAAQEIVKTLQASGTRIDGVGLQSHFIVGESPSKEDLVENMEAFTALGVEVALTELDIRIMLPNTTALLAQQSMDYENTVAACLAVEDCVGITVWDFDDKYSWIPSTFTGFGDADLFDDNLVRTPAYYGVVDALLAGRATNASAALTKSSNGTKTSALSSATLASFTSGTSSLSADLFPSLFVLISVYLWIM